MKDCDLGPHMAKKFSDKQICQKKDLVPGNQNEFLTQTKWFSAGNKNRKLYCNNKKKLFW